MSDSILDSVKKAVGIATEYTVFDEVIILHINTALSTLNELGIGPDSGFMVEDNTALWTDFLSGNNLYNDVKTYVYLRVRMLFDPPTTSFAIAAMESQIKELEWRINVKREHSAWVNPASPIELSEDFVFDGGSA